MRLRHAANHFVAMINYYLLTFDLYVLYKQSLHAFCQEKSFFGSKARAVQYVSYSIGQLEIPVYSNGLDPHMLFIFKY